MGTRILDALGMLKSHVHQVPEFDEELVNIDALRGDQAEVKRRLEPAAGEDGSFEKGFSRAIWTWHPRVLAGHSVPSRNREKKTSQESRKAGKNLEGGRAGEKGEVAEALRAS